MPTIGVRMCYEHKSKMIWLRHIGKEIKYK